MHLRIEMPNGHAARISQKERFILVDDEGNETDFSQLVTAASIPIKPGDVFAPSISFIKVRVVEAEEVEAGLLAA